MTIREASEGINPASSRRNRAARNWPSTISAGFRLDRHHRESRTRGPDITVRGRYQRRSWRRHACHTERNGKQAERHRPRQVRFCGMRHKDRRALRADRRQRDRQRQPPDAPGYRQTADQAIDSVPSAKQYDHPAAKRPPPPAIQGHMNGIHRQESPITTQATFCKDVDAKMERVIAVGTAGERDPNK